MKRLYYLTQNIDSADSISSDLHTRGVNDWRFHIISKNESGLYNHHLHSANVFYRTDIIRYGERGAIIGSSIGLLIGLWLYFNGYANLAAAMALVVGFAFFGAWAGGLGGISQENYKLRRFHDDISRGLYLIMVDVRAKDVGTIRFVMAEHHPEAVLQALDNSTFNNPFAWQKAP